MGRNNFSPNCIYNKIVTKLEILVYSPIKMIAVTGVKQIGGITSGERELNTTTVGAINVLDNHVPLMFIYP